MVPVNSVQLAISVRERGFGPEKPDCRELDKSQNQSRRYEQCSGTEISGLLSPAPKRSFRCRRVSPFSSGVWYLTLSLTASQQASRTPR